MNKGDFRQTIFIPVGTTLIYKAKTLYPKSKLESLYNEIKLFKNSCYPLIKNGSDKSNEIEWRKWCNLTIGNNYYKDYANVYKKDVDPKKEIERRRNQEFSEDKPDYLTAELAGLYLFYDDRKLNDAAATNNLNRNSKDEIILLASDTNEGLYCACFLAEYLTKIAPFKDNIGKVIVEVIIDLGQGQGGYFQEQGLNNLVEQTAKLIGERQEKNPLYLNITGGFKGALPYLTLLGLAFGEMEVFYLFEFSPNLVWLPKIPVGFDLLTWRDYRAFIRSIPHIQEFKEEYLPAFIPDSMRILLSYEAKNKRLVLNVLGKALYMQYEKERGKGISEHGRGYLLTDLIKCRDKRSAIMDCIDCWQYLWIGDLIPETVEHGRGHVQRDLELLAQIIFPILKREPNFFHEDDGQSDDNLLVLLSSIWLHDLGHSGSYLECDNANGLLKDGSSIKLNIKGFPSMVRDIHHFLSWYLIKNDHNDLFKLDLIHDSADRNKKVFSDNILEAIRFTCLYHRGKMPVKKGNIYEHVGIKIEKPLEEISSSSGVNLPLMGALLRMADEGEVQRERTISEEYENMRLLQNKRELSRLEKEEAELRSALNATLLCSDGMAKGNTDPLNFMQKVLNIAGEYFNEIDKEDSKDKDFDIFVNEYIKKYFNVNNKELRNIENEVNIAFRNWLGILNQYIFKKRQPAHFEKHRGISYLMYLFDKEDYTITNGKQGYHYKVLAIYRQGKDHSASENYILNAKNVLKGISEEYEKVSWILNKHRIYFDSYWIMEEGDIDKKMIKLEF